MRYKHTVRAFRAHLNTLYTAEEIRAKFPGLIRNKYHEVLADLGRFGHLLRLGDEREFDRLRERWDGNPKASPRAVVGCVCMTCGRRNDFTHPDGLCPVGDHDNWLEYRDVVARNEFFDEACIIFNRSADQMTDDFMNISILQFDLSI